MVSLVKFIVDRSFPQSRAMVCCAGAILLTAASAKWTSQVAAPDEMLAVAASFPVLLQVLAQCEATLGVALLSGMYPVLTWRLAVVTFVAFSGAAMAQAARGFGSCGCFGNAGMSPVVAFSIDVAIVFGLLRSPPRPPVASASRGARGGANVQFFAWGSVLSCVLAFSAVYFDQELTASVFGDDAVLSEPSLWVGKHCPLLAHIDIEAQVSRGSWKLVMLRRGCSACEGLIRRLERNPDTNASEQTGIIELGPVNLDRRTLPFVYGRLPRNKSWRLRVPMILHLVDGRVSSIE